MARGGSRANSEFSKADRGIDKSYNPGNFRQAVEANAVDEAIKAYNPMDGKEHRQLARSVLLDAFSKSEWSSLGLPDSLYARDALDAMQKMSENWTASNKAPTKEGMKEFRQIAQSAVDSIIDELNQEAAYLRAEYIRERDNNIGGSRARSELVSRPTQPDGSETKFPKMRESLRLLKDGSPTISGIKDTGTYAFNVLNQTVGRLVGVDINDLPDSNKVWDKVRSMTVTLDRFIKKPETMTDDAIIKFRKSAEAAGKKIAKLALRDEL